VGAESGSSSTTRESPIASSLEQVLLAAGPAKAPSGSAPTGLERSTWEGEASVQRTAGLAGVPAMTASVEAAASPSVPEVLGRSSEAPSSKMASGPAAAGSEAEWVTRPAGVRPKETTPLPYGESEVSLLGEGERARLTLDEGSTRSAESLGMTSDKIVMA